MVVEKVRLKVVFMVYNTSYLSYILYKAYHTLNLNYENIIIKNGV